MKKYIQLLTLVFFTTRAIAQTNTFPTTGNVGIGTTSPGTNLQVNGYSSMGDNFDPIPYGFLQLVRPGTISDSKFHLSFIRGGYSVSGMGYAPNSNVLGIWHANNNLGTPLMAFTPGQNVGIGTATPSNKLTIVGSGQGDGLWMYGTGTTNIALLNNMGAGSWNSLTQAGDNMLLWKGTTADGANAGGLVLGPWSNTVTGMRIASNGNVGIGVSSPVVPLMIQSSSIVDAGLGSLRITGDNNTERVEIVSSTGPIFQGQRSRGTIANPLVVQSEDILSSLAARGYDGSAFPLTSGSVGLVSIKSTETYSSTNHGSAIVFETTQNGTTTRTEKMRIDGSGNVSIGSTYPAFKLDIASKDNEGATRLRLANTISSGVNAPGSLPTIEVLGARGDGNTTFEGRLALGTRRTDGNPLSNQTLGAVLFGGQYGTDNTFQSNKILYPASIQGIAEGNFTDAGTMPTGIVFLTGSAGHDVATTNLSYGTERMRITNSGNIGIGTTTPQAKLAVNGDIFSKKVKVTQTGWPDYVFHKDFKLPSLSEVEEYIQQHKHLPEVPSAQEVEEKGLDLGDNQAVLLKKIEEITLYLIEQNKRQQETEARVKQLQEENQQLKEQVKKIKSPGK